MSLTAVFPVATPLLRYTARLINTRDAERGGDTSYRPGAPIARRGEVVMRKHAKKGLVRAVRVWGTLCMNGGALCADSAVTVAIQSSPLQLASALVAAIAGVAKLPEVLADGIGWKAGGATPRAEQAS